jgi:putative membrane-bound dehydrogenase-like protein
MSNIAMNIRFSLRVLILLLASALVGQASVPSIARAAKIVPAYQPPNITVPDGFVVELVAGPPLVHHPIMAGFDDEGRLFVSETVGLNLNNKDLDKQTPNHVTLLEDADGDGFFDKSTMFADKMTFPQGGLWHQGALYVCSPPGLWRLEDTNGDGKADKRDQIATGFAYTGNAADVHGPFLHPNGRLYWCHGRKGHEVYQNDGKTLVSKNKGARIWSCKPDGSDVQVHAGGGMDNPTELTITPEGDILGSVNLFYGRPRGDVLVHWLYGGAYPRHDQAAVIAEFPRTGELLKEIVNYGHVAVSGLTRYQSDAFGEEYRDNVFVTFFNTHKLTRTILTREGSSYSSRTEEFFHADSDGFHCTDVLEDADGSLLVIDTGGWFRIGCPTSQIAKPELHGGIYRIRKKDAKPVKDPRGRGIDWKNSPAGGIAALLDDSRFAVRDRAMRNLASRKDLATLDALSDTMRGGAAVARRNAVWVAARIGGPEAASLARLGLQDKDADVRQSACHAAAILNDRESVTALAAILRNDQPQVQREAAVTLGRLGDSRGATALLDLLSRDGIDRSLEHALIYGLIELSDMDRTLDGFKVGNENLQRRTLIALNEMKNGFVASGMVLPLLDSANDDLRATAIGVARAREDWAGGIAERIEGWVDSGKFDERRSAAVKGILPTLVSQPRIRALLGRMLAQPGKDSAVFGLALEVISESVGAGLDKSWEQPLKRALLSKDAGVAADAIGAAAALKSKTFDEILGQLGADESMPALLRVKALSGMTSKAGALDESTFGLLLKQLGPGASAGIRGEAARMFAKARLSRVQLMNLSEAVAQAGALELPILLDAFYKSRDLQVGERFVDALQMSPGVGNVPPDEIKRMLTRYPPAVLNKAKPLLDRLLAQRAQQAERLAELEASLLEGDLKRGEAVFHSQKTLCAVCHRVGDKGGQVGPDLTRVGRIRTTRDLLESVLYPSSSIARDFETYSIDTHDGESHTGVILRESHNEVEIAVVSGQPMKLARKSIAAIRPSSLSLMPQGLDQAMSKQEFSDLIAFLKSRQ